jgi:hypothetical protein
VVSTIHSETFPNIHRLFVSDFDGTLFRSDRTIAFRDLKALQTLGELGIVRAIATGRSLYSLGKANYRDFPVDYIIFSTGAGILDLSGHDIIKTAHMSAEDTRHAIAVLNELELDFMIHLSIPDNHRFLYQSTNLVNPDFARRLRLYQDHCLPFDKAVGFHDAYRASQVVTIIPPERFSEKLLATIQARMKTLNVIRATSPLDGKSVWIEIFPGEVSKSRATAWLTRRLGIRAENVLMVGNDYNDVDLLEWCGQGFVVGNAPAELKARYATVASNDNHGVDEAIQKWLATGEVN